MARGRHVKRSGLLARLWPARRRRGTPAAGRATHGGHGAHAGPVVGPTAYAGTDGTARSTGAAGPGADPALVQRLDALEGEVSRLRVLGIAHAAAAASADVRARRAEEQLTASRAELTGLRTDLAALREELVWAFAERKLAVETAAGVPAVVDLREGSARTA